MNAILAIDGGGTRTRAGLYDEAGNLLAEAEGGPTNVAEIPWKVAVNEIAALGRQLESRGSWKVSQICAGLAGAGMMGFGKPIADSLSSIFRTTSVLVANDLYTLFHANCDAIHPLLIIAGTGSSVVARNSHGCPEQLGGLGPILGDEGSSYSVAIEAIRHALQPRVRDERSNLSFRLMDALGLPSNWWLFPWVRYARKDEIAALAVVVTDEAGRGNTVARDILRRQAGLLAELVLEVIPKAQLRLKTDDEFVVLVSGGLFQNSDYFRSSFLRSLRGHYRHVRLDPPRLVGHEAAFQLHRATSDDGQIARPGGKYVEASLLGTEGISYERPLLEELSSERVSRRMTDVELAAVDGIRSICPSIGGAVNAAATCLRAGGRIIYAGAGTSGRLGVLDASECPPTFGVDEGRVIGLIAGGDAALRHSIEGAEDDTDAARRDIDAIAPPVGVNDIVIGITASGTTPYALAAIDRARELGAKTGLVACNPVPLDRADHVIALDTGPEVLPGSTRLKAGTATKIVLNQISTGAMAKAGYVFEGRMVGVRPLNKKLRQRCIRIIAELTKEDEAAAEKRLDETGGSIRLAVLMARKGLTLDEARRRLDAAHGVLRDAVEAK